MERLLCILAAAALGLLLHHLSIPIPFMLGGAVTAAALKFTVRPKMRWPQLWRSMGLCVAGYGIGRNFTAETALHISQQVAGIVAATAIAVILALISAVWTSRHTFADLHSNVMGMLPGGINQMLMLADEDPRIDANVVAVQQTLRLFGVVLSVPFLVVHLLGAVPVPEAATLLPSASGGVTWLTLVPLGAIGAFTAKKLHFPIPFLVGPIFATSIFSYFCAEGLQKVPFALMGLAQINIGLYIGCMLDREKMKKAGVLVPYSLLSTALMVAVSTVVARYLSAAYGFSVVTAFLAMAPGGSTEMCLVGLSMGEDVSTIMAYQLFRVLVMNFLAPFCMNRYFGNPPQKTDTGI